MDLKKLICLHRGHKGHVSKLITATEEILAKLSQAQELDTNSKLSPPDAVLLADLVKQLHLKAQLFEELDAKIIDATDNDEKLEEAVFESADLQASLSAKIALFSHTLAITSPLHSPAVYPQTGVETNASPPSNSSTTSNSSENPQAEQDSDTQTSHADHVSITSNHSVHQPAVDSSNISQSSSQARPSSFPHESTEPNFDRHFAVRLPKLEIPAFNGEPLEWHPFWDCFEAAIHTNPTLSNVQKLSYLRAQLKGEAAMVIAGLLLTKTINILLTF